MLERRDEKGDRRKRGEERDGEGWRENNKSGYENQYLQFSNILVHLQLIFVRKN